MGTVGFLTSFFTKYREHRRASYLYMVVLRQDSKTLNTAAYKSANRLLREI